MLKNYFPRKKTKICFKLLFLIKTFKERKHHYIFNLFKKFNDYKHQNIYFYYIIKVLNSIS